MLMSCVTIWPHCMLTSVNCGSAMSSSPNATNETKREFGNSVPVTDAVGDEYPSPYFGEMSREYLNRFHKKTKLKTHPFCERSRL